MTKRRDSKHDEARRAFLVGAAVGAATGAGLVPGAVAQEKQPAAPASARAQSSGDEHGAFFNDDDAAACFLGRLQDSLRIDRLYGISIDDSNRRAACFQFGSGF